MDNFEQSAPFPPFPRKDSPSPSRPSSPIPIPSSSPTTNPPPGFSSPADVLKRYSELKNNVPLHCTEGKNLAPISGGGFLSYHNKIIAIMLEIFSNYVFIKNIVCMQIIQLKIFLSIYIEHIYWYEI